MRIINQNYKKTHQKQYDGTSRCCLELTFCKLYYCHIHGIILVCNIVIYMQLSGVYEGLFFKGEGF